MCHPNVPVRLPGDILHDGTLDILFLIEAGVRTGAGHRRAGHLLRWAVCSVALVLAGIVITLRSSGGSPSRKSSRRHPGTLTQRLWRDGCARFARICANFQAENGTRMRHILPAVASEYRFRPRCQCDYAGRADQGGGAGIGRIRQGGGSCVPLCSLRRAPLADGGTPPGECAQRVQPRMENRARIRATTNGAAEGEWVAAKA